MLMFKFLRITSSVYSSCCVRNLVFCARLVGEERNRLSLRFYSSSSSAEELDPHAFAKSYLITSCGLSPEIAVPISKKLKFQTPENPDLVLSLLREYGFQDAHISRLIRVIPRVLQSDPDKTIRPKLDYFRNVMGFSNTQLANILSMTEYFFRSSLEKRIIPCCEFLRSVLLDDTKVAISLKSSSCILRNDVHQYIGPNIEILRQLGAPHSVISYAVTRYPHMFNQKHDKFSAGINDAIEMGFKPSHLSFIPALHAITCTSKSKWEQNINIYKSRGWSNDDIFSAFKRNPRCLTISEKRISSVMDFLVNKMSFPASTIAKTPKILCYSFEKRVVPRSRVYRILQLNGLMVKEYAFTRSVIEPSEKQFLDKFVSPYREQVPHLLDIYKGRTGFSQLDF